MDPDPAKLNGSGRIRNTAKQIALNVHLKLIKLFFVKTTMFVLKTFEFNLIYLFRVCTLSITDPGDSDIIRTMPGAQAGEA